jgi:DNA polymerase IV
MISALVIGDFAIAVEHKLNPALANAPIVIASEHARPKVVSASERCRQDGVTTANTVRQAEALCPDVEVLPVNRSAYERWSVEIAEVLLQYSDKVEIEYQATTTAFYVNSTDLLMEMQNAVESILGVIAGIGVASNKFTARVAGAYAVRTELNRILVQQGKESEFFSTYPVTILPLDKTMKRRLPLLGIETIGQYASLPKGSILEQFGKFGRRLHDLANGIDIRPLSAYTPPERLVETIELEDAIENYQSVEQLIEELAQALLLQLNSRQAHHLTLILRLENRQILEQAIQPPDPMTGFKSIVERATSLLYHQAIDSGIVGIELQLHDLSQPQPKQLSLFDTLDPIQSLSAVLPTWQQRHQETDFLAVNLEPTPVYYIPEYQCRYVAVSA